MNSILKSGGTAIAALFLAGLASSVAAQPITDLPDGPPGDIADLTEAHFAVDGTLESVKMLQFSNDEKTLYFVPMIHQAEAAFYETVAGVVESIKADGADLYYEFVDFEAASHEDQLRIRAMLGFLPTPSFYAENVSEGLVAQDNSAFLGFPGGRDVNADLTPADLADAYEALMGRLEITEENRSTPMNEFVMPTSDLARTPTVIIDLRNRHLANMIETAPTDVVVLFGAAHGPGTLAELLRLNSNWQRVAR